MSDPATSPDISHEDQDEDQLDIGDVEPEDMVDEEVDGEGDAEDDEKPDAQEGLDLDMAEEDGIGYQDEPDGDHEPAASNGDHERICEGNEEGTKSKNAEDEVTAKEEDVHIEEKEEKDDEDTEDLLSRPPHGSEVFVGGITKDTTEEDLREICSSCGDIFEVRLSKDKENGENKGYAFVTFTNKECAEKAIETLNDSELKGRKLRFLHSQSKHRLFVGNVPKTWDKEELEKVLAEKGLGIESVELLKDPQNPGRNRGFAFVEYYNHACAEYARKNMSKPNFKLGTNAPTVSWADPRGGSDSASMSQVKVVYVRNLTESVTQEQLRKLFEHHGEISKVVLPASKPGQPKRDFGFIHFADRSSALKAIEKTEKYELEGRVLETSLAKPPTERRPHGLETGYPPQRPSLLPQHQSRMGYGYSASDLYGVGSGYGSSRGYNQPVIYGRGPPPAGMTMVPMMLPDGRVGYVLQQQPGMQGGSAPYRAGRGGHGLLPHRQSGGNSGGGGSGGSSRRYRPY